MKWLAVDYGDSRTGLAGCDESETVTSPITPQIEEKSMNKVAAAVVEVVHEKHPDMDIKVANAQGLRECRKLMNMAKVGKYNGYLLEGMACPGGCIAGAGTILPINEATKGVEASMKLASKKNPLESKYADMAEKLD